MKLLKIFFIALFLFSSSLKVKGQDFIKNSSITGVCYAGQKVNRIYIPPPDKFFSKSGKKGNASVTIYYSGFSAQAEIALDYAASILEDILPDNTKLTISASWEKITTPGVLANSSITGYIGGWAIDAQYPLAIYPVALAEKILGASLNDDLEGDMHLAVNSSINWYLGTDGQTPGVRYDLVTVVLHEVCHGLGFYDSFYADDTIGWYGFPVHFMSMDSVDIINDTLPMIYDKFIENNSGKSLTAKSYFKNFSTDLKALITGGQLFFKGPVSNRSISGGKAKVWAPPVFDQGSTITHLDEDKTAKEDALMTPYIDLGEAIHNPGMLTFSILADLGWINTRINHKPPKYTEEHLSDIPLTVEIVSDTSYNRDIVGVVYSFDKFRTSDTLYMTSPDMDDFFKTIISLPYYNCELQYYIFVRDYFLRDYRSPSLNSNELFRYKVCIGTDTVKPVISHTPVTYYLQTSDSISFEASAKDSLGIDSVYIEYKVNNGSSDYIGLNAGKSHNYRASFSARILNLNGGDSIKYRLFAIDSAQSHNMSVLPENGYFVIPVEKILTVVESYSTDFTDASADFFNIGFDISKPPDFSRFGLNTKHPYISPEDNDKSIDYTSLLRYPLRFNESGVLISFNEIVLVEPGEPGSLFGYPEFYDYVIVEGSKNFGKTWFPLADGYDSRLIPAWESAYNNSIVGQNSTFIGDESMLHKHTIFYNQSDKIAVGDTMLLRFRLYSDPYANGWGWIIEDLKINPLVDALEKTRNDFIKIYPNPGNGFIRVSMESTDITNTKPLYYSIFNSVGTCIVRNLTLEISETQIDISEYPNGLYLIVLYRNDGIITTKYSLIK